MSDEPKPAPAKPWSRWLRLAAVVLPALISGLATHEGCPKTVQVLKEVEKRVEVVAPALDEFEGRLSRDGWQPDAEASAKDAATVQFRTFSDTPAGQVQALPKQVYLWGAETKLTGKPTPAKDQNPEGSCVGFGTTTAIERSLAADIVARGGDASEFAHFSEEITYVGSRVQGARLVGGSTPRGQGSAGVYAKAWVTGFGMVPKANYPGVADLTTYSAARAGQWRMSGCPRDLEAVAKKYPVRDGAKVANWKECKQALANGYGVAICSTLSFARQRDARGVASQTREGWNHCMTIDGYHTDEAGREFGHVENSWSDLPDANGRRTGQSYHTGPVGWGTPTTAGFWASADVLDAGLRQGESYAYSGAVGFPRKVLPVDWFVNNRAQEFRPVLPMLPVALAW